VRHAGASALLAIAVTAASGLVAPPSTEGGVDSGRGCRIHLRTVAEDHGQVFTTRCSFKQVSIEIRTNSRIWDIEHRPKLSRNTDPEDRFRCRRLFGPPRVRCHGQAGDGARVRGFFETQDFACDTSSRVEELGGFDCDNLGPNEGCPAIGFGDHKRFSEPRGC
jgi:hypothetical protein